jgi:indolepyruvate ferredoxin oxidoreductase, beta subunit
MSDSSPQPIKIAILAMGGEGGGVLADWIVDLGEANGFIAQSTSVPGVAQRTGATIYYVELFPVTPADAPGRSPVLALMPMAGDVDVVLASELMEAGRAVQRGLVTVDRTTLIASTHRVYSIAEKSALGDGRVDSAALLHETRAAARHAVCFDMAATAEACGSVISAVLFGALCGAEVLPFDRARFEATIERGGVGVAGSLRAFALGLTLAGEQTAAAQAASPAPASSATMDAGRAAAAHTPSSVAAVRPCAPVARLLERIERDFPPASHSVLREGIRRLVDYQDPAYGGLYLDRLAALQAERGVEAGELLGETARHLALWMSYEDTIRVADLKTRSTRFERVRREVGAQAAQVLEIGEFMHPRLEEICETLPAAVGRWLLKPHWAHRLLARCTSRGRVVKTSSLSGFLLLYGLSRWRRGRRSTLRFAMETERIEAWLARVRRAARDNAALAVELAKCQRLVKGYGDTHARGLKNFQTLMGVFDRHPLTLAPATLSELRGAALDDEQGLSLAALLVRSGLN